jgi:hypothetical protein
MVARFQQSDFVFQRSVSRAPFVPLAYLDVTHYGDTELRRGLDGGDGASFDQTIVSQAAFVPVLVSPKDAIGAGEWLTATHFDATETEFDV